jgi:hypothetical protein
MTLYLPKTDCGHWCLSNKLKVTLLFNKNPKRKAESFITTTKNNKISPPSFCEKLNHVPTEFKENINKHKCI